MRVVAWDGPMGLLRLHTKLGPKFSQLGRKGKPLKQVGQRGPRDYPPAPLTACTSATGIACYFTSIRLKGKPKSGNMIFKALNHYKSTFPITQIDEFIVNSVLIIISDKSLIS